MNPGVYPGLSRAEYEAIPAANYSTLKHFNLSPAHAREYMIHPPEPSKAMEFGTALHSAILEPTKFKKEYIVAPTVDRRTKEGKAAWVAFEAEHPGGNYLSTDEMEGCNTIIKGIDENETATLLLRGEGKNEMCVVWVDEETGLLCKGLIDRFTSLFGWGVVVDIKSTVSAFPPMFAAQSARMSYHVQAAFYIDGLNAVAPSERRFITLAIEKTRPFCMSAFEYDEQAISEGRAAYRRYLNEYNSCKETGKWPGYPAGINPLSLPKWAIKDQSYE